MHKESLGALRSQSTAIADSKATPKEKQIDVQSKLSVFSRRNSGRPRPTPLLRETAISNPMAESSAALQSPSKASEKYVLWLCKPPSTLANFMSSNQLKKWKDRGCFPAEQSAFAPDLSIFLDFA